MNKDKLWLLIDSTHKKLLRARLWTTSLDDYKQDIEDAVRALENAKKKIEEGR
jgi:hypothetical protein